MSRTRNLPATWVKELETRPRTEFEAAQHEHLQFHEKIESFRRQVIDLKVPVRLYYVNLFRATTLARTTISDVYSDGRKFDFETQQTAIFLRSPMSRTINDQ